MNGSRWFAAVAAGLALAGAQCAVAGVAHAQQARQSHAASVSDYGFDAEWGGGHQPQVLPPGFAGGHSFQLAEGGEPATSPADVNVLMMYTLGAPKLDGTDVPDLPAGFTVTLTDGDCAPAAQAATGTGTAAFVCDMDQTGSVPYASFDEHIGTATPDGTVIGTTAIIVPHEDDTLAGIQAALQAGEHFTTNADLSAVESLARAQQDGVTAQVADFAAGQTATETVAVHAVDHGTVTVETASATPGEVWTDPAIPWIDWQDVFLPPGLNATGVVADGGATCDLVPVEYQNDANNYSTNDLDLATCSVTPDTTSITLTFTSAATLPQTAVQLTAGYHVYDNTHAPFTSSTGDFTVTAAS